MKKSRKRIAALLVCIVAIIAIVSGSLAWYTSTNTSSQNGKLFGFKSYGNVYFETSDGKKYTATADDNGMYQLSLDASAKNYIGNFRVNVIQKGYAKYYVRVKMNVQWTMPDGSIAPNSLIPFNFADNWYDNRSTDYCVYYTEDSGLFAHYDESIIKGFDEKEFLNTRLTESAVPSISVSVESVQINRYQQIWGIDELPWK